MAIKTSNSYSDDFRSRSSANIDAHYGPWTSIDGNEETSYQSWRIADGLNNTPIKEGTQIAIKPNASSEVTLKIYSKGVWKDVGSGKVDVSNIFGAICELPQGKQVMNLKDEDLYAVIDSIRYPVIMKYNPRNSTAIFYYMDTDGNEFNIVSVKVSTTGIITLSGIASDPGSNPLAMVQIVFTSDDGLNTEIRTMTDVNGGYSVSLAAGVGYNISSPNRAIPANAPSHINGSFVDRELDLTIM